MCLKSMLVSKKKPSKLNVGLTSGIYCSVLAACFGGIKFDMGSGTNGIVHPFMLLLTAFPLFIVQVSVIIALRMQLSSTDPWYDDTMDSMQLLRVKLLMVLVVYLMNFQMLMQSTTLLFFILNPVTWIEVKQVDPEKWYPTPSELDTDKHWFQSFILDVLRGSVASHWVMPTALCSISMRFIVGYIVCTDSVSVILHSQNVPEAVFNSLAITFLVDLDVQWWTFCMVACHLSGLDHFRFMLLPDGEVWQDPHWHDSQLNEERGKKLCFAKLYQFILKITSWGKDGCSFLRRGHGYTRCQSILVSIVLYVIYRRQLYIVLFAIKTRVVPVARDICTSIGLHQGTGFSSTVFSILEHIVVVDMNSMLEHISEHAFKGRCGDDGEFHRMYASDEWELLQEHWWVELIFVIVMGGMLVLPQLSYSLATKSGTGIYHSMTTDDLHGDDDDDYDDDAKNMRTSMRAMGANNQELLHRITKLEKSMRFNERFQKEYGGRLEDGDDGDDRDPVGTKRSDKGRKSLTFLGAE